MEKEELIQAIEDAKRALTNLQGEIEDACNGVNEATPEIVVIMAEVVRTFTNNIFIETGI